MLFGSTVVGVMTLPLFEISSTEKSEQPKARTATKINSFDEVGGVNLINFDGIFFNELRKKF